MKRAKKIILIAIVVVILLIGGGVLWIDHLAKLAVETGATYALGVETTLGGMDIGIIGGTVDLSTLNVANPPAFESPHFMKLGGGNLAVSLGSLMEDKVVVPLLALSGISMNLERRGGKANYQVILDNLGKFESKEDPAPASKPASTEGGKKFVVNRVSIDDVKVQVDLLPIGGELTRVPLQIERIVLTNVGSDSADGVELAQLIDILMKAILQAVVSKGGDLLPADIAGELASGLQKLEGLGGATVEVVGEVTTMVGGEIKRVGELGTEALKDLSESGSKLGEELEDAGKKVGEELEDTGKKLEEGLGGLFGGVKKKTKDESEDDKP